MPKKDNKVMTEKDKALDSAIAAIEKSYGKGTIMRLGDGHNRMTVETISMTLQSSFLRF